jgi:hypothetical protein
MSELVRIWPETQENKIPTSRAKSAREMGHPRYRDRFGG